MENNLNNIDHLFKDGLGSYTETPPPDVWDALERRLDGDRKKRGAAFRWPWFIVMVLVVGVFSSILALNISGNSIGNILGGNSNTIADAQKTSSDANGNVSSVPANNAQHDKIVPNSTNNTGTTAHKTHKKRTHKNNIHTYDNNTTPSSVQQITATNSIADKIAAQNTNAVTANNDVAGTYTNADTKAQTDNHYTRPVKYVVKNKVKNNIQVAESEPILASGNNYAGNASSSDDDEEEQMTFGKNVVYASTINTPPPATHSSAISKTVAHTNKPAIAAKTGNNVAAFGGNKPAQQNTTVVANTQQKVVPAANVPASAIVTNTKTKSTSQSSATTPVNSTTPTKTQTVTTTTVTNKTQPADNTTQTNTTVVTQPAAAATNMVAKTEPANKTSVSKTTSTETTVTKKKNTTPSTEKTVAVNKKTAVKNNMATHLASVKNVVNTSVAKVAPVAAKTQPVTKTVATTIKKETVPAHTTTAQTVVVKKVEKAKPASVKTNTFAAAKTQPAAKTHAVISKKTVAADNKTIQQTTSAKKVVKSTPTVAKVSTPAITKAKTATKTVTTASKKNVVDNTPVHVASVKTAAKTKATINKKPVKDGGEKIAAKHAEQKDKHNKKITPAIGSGNGSDATITSTKNKKNKHTKAAKPAQTTPINNYATANNTEDKPVAITTQPTKIVPQAQKIMGTFKTDTAAPSMAPKVVQNTPVAAVTTQDSNNTKHKLLSGYDYGVKLGYEGGFNSQASEKLVVSGFIEHKLLGKFSYMLQPALKSSRVNSRSIDGTQSFYDTSAATIQSKNYLLIVVGNTDTFYKHDYTYTQSHDSIVKSYGIGGNHIELELPLLLKYKITDKLSVYGGANIGISKFIAIKENTYISDPISRTVNTVNVSHQYQPNAPSTYSMMKYSGTAIEDYKGPLYPTPPGVSFRLGYMLGFSYELRKKWLLDALIQQSFAKSNIQGGYNTNTSLSLPYFRLTVGYKLSK